MLRNALVFAFMVLVVMVWFILPQIDFLIPYKRVLFGYYWHHMAWFFGLLMLNLMGLYIYFDRVIFKKETGGKMLQIDKQLSNGAGALLPELSARMNEE